MEGALRATWSETCQGQDPDTAVCPFTILLRSFTWGLIEGTPHPESQAHNQKKKLVVSRRGIYTSKCSISYCGFHCTDCHAAIFTMHRTISSGGKPAVTHPAQKPQELNSWQATTQPCLNQVSLPCVSAVWDIGFYTCITHTHTCETLHTVSTPPPHTH